MTDDTPLDDSVLAKDANHNEEAFAALYRRYVNLVYRYLYRRLGSTKDAEDLTSQVFMDVMEYLENYREKGRFSSWLFTIARRRLADHYRLRQTDHLEDAVDVQEDSPHLETVMEERDAKAFLDKLISRLDRERQEILLLRFAAGLSFSEMADLLNRSEGSVKMMLYRTLDWLRDNWEIVDEV
jgi:RNA polymerase sigma-70 factor, ECF subfamily